MTTMIAGLAPEQREALLLTQLLGLPYADAAAVCGCPIGTIRSRVARARDALLADVGTRRPDRLTQPGNPIGGLFYAAHNIRPGR